MTKLNYPAPILVAHRGYSGRYPENTLLSYEAAYQHGARYMELDLQMTVDNVPILHHDTSLMRMSGVEIDIRDIHAKELKRYNASYPERFGNEFADNRFTKLKKFCKWLKQKPDATVFIEFKQESIDRIGVPLFVDEVYRRVLDTGISQQCVFISFNSDIVQYARAVSSIRTGWVLPKWSKENGETLQTLKPGFIFCDKRFLPQDDQQIWRGNWQWAIYNLDDVASAIEMANRDMPFLETNQIGLLMQDRELANRN